MKSATILDVARAANISKATVSRVLNNSPLVDPKTKERVLAVIEELKYSPSATARSLSKRESSIIGMIVPEVDNPFFGEVMRGVTEVIEKNNLMLICCNTDDDRENDIKALGMLKEHRVRGLLYTPAIDYSEKEEQKELKIVLNELDIPVVLMDRLIGSLDFDGICFNDSEAMYQATLALIDAGHTKIGIINGTLDRVLARIRQSGYIKALEERGIAANETHMFFGNFRMTKAYELSKQLLDLDDLPTAVLTCNNRTTLGFLKALYEKKMSLDNIACIGLDRIEPIDIINEDLNYIKRDAKEMGRKAIEMLLERIQNPGSQIRKIVLDTPLVIKNLNQRTKPTSTSLPQ